MDSIYRFSANLGTLPIHLVRRFGFSESESALCLELLHGKTINDIADDFRLPRTEVRQRFERLLEKTGVNSEAKLITLMLASTEQYR